MWLHLANNFETMKACYYAYPLASPGGLEAYGRRKDELGVQHGVMFWGARDIIPLKGRDTLLDSFVQEYSTCH